MSKKALSRDQLQEINNFLDAELASAGEDVHSGYAGSTFAKNNRLNLRYQLSPPQSINQTFSTQN